MMSLVGWKRLKSRESTKEDGQKIKAASVREKVSNDPSKKKCTQSQRVVPVRTACGKKSWGTELIQKYWGKNLGGGGKESLSWKKKTRQGKATRCRRGGAIR